MNIFNLLRDHGWSNEGAQNLLDHRDDPSIARLVRRLTGAPAVRTPKQRQTPTKQSIPHDLRWHVWKRDNFTCCYCGTRDDLSVDHIVPESRGGTLDLSNLQTLCRTCNSRKGVR